MLVVEVACLLIVAVYVVSALRRDGDRRQYLRRYGVLALASWIAEDSCIRLYGFYGYSAEWFPQLDRTPLVVVLIWPVVILSARELGGHLLRRRGRLPLVGSLLVLADASFMEPIAVRAGLWSWTEPGLFGVPPIGLLGWAFFAGFCLTLFEQVEARGLSPWSELIVVLVGPLATHLALLATWWGLGRWVSHAIPSRPAAIAVCLGSLLLGTALVRLGTRKTVPLGAIATRIPAALFFFVLLAQNARSDWALVAYALAFAPPYLALCDWGLVARPRPGAGRRRARPLARAGR